MNISIESEKLRYYLKISILMFAVLFAYGRVMPLLWSVWYRDDYSHGILVPFVSLYLIWIDRDKLRDIAVKPNPWIGFSLLSLSALLLATGMVGSIIAIQHYSLLVLIPGLIVLFWGVSCLKALFLPLAYLVLMVPFLDPLLDYIHWPLQISTSMMVSFFLNILRVPILHSSQYSQYIELPNAMLEVAEECSGLQFLIAMIAIGIPLAKLTQRFIWQKIIIVISAVIVGLMSNWLRVLIAALWTYYTGQFSHGPIHTFKGMLVAVIGFILLFTEAKILSRASSPIPNHRRIPEEGVPMTLSHRQLYGGWLVAVMFLFLGIYLFFYSPTPVPLNTPLNKLSLSQVGTWEGRQIGKYSEPLMIPNADSEITMTYEDKTGYDVNVYIGYYESQSQDKELINESLKQLQSDVSQVQIDVANNGLFYVNRKIINYGTERYLLLFWYNINGRTVTDKYKVKFYTILDGLIHGRTNGALIMVFCPFRNNEEIKAVETVQRTFIRNFYPLVNEHLSKIRIS